jgi:hypothetical protein
VAANSSSPASSPSPSGYSEMQMKKEVRTSDAKRFSTGCQEEAEEEEVMEEK